MYRTKRKPTSPGEILFEEFLKPLGITLQDLASRLQIDENYIQKIIEDKASLTPGIAKKLAIMFGTTSEFWLNAQNAVDSYKKKI